MHQQPPWLAHPELRPTRLSALAAQLQNVWDGCLALHDPAEGDNGWVLGSRFYQRACFRISQLAGQQGFGWLSVIDPSRHYVYAIGNCPIRFFHGDEERLRPRAGRIFPLEQAAREAQLVLMPEFFAAVPRAWRMMIVTESSEGPVLRIALVEVDDKGRVIPETEWTIPVTTVVPFSPAGAPPAAGVPLPPPVVGPKIPATTPATGNNQNNGPEAE